ncbi:DUF5107 domain-containing protein [Flammeovirga sp. OC4]|uniref:DUF5107 domain-containing protein n=1 Tax=Flammeovirga sp. OC4 TaxID=1382345 RepID=UPI0005C620D3|nr:DUF5107 domain-containing protein [Flammeovirga sp. OC4]
MEKVKAWREVVSIPTYEIGKPEKNPIFLEKRVYQGSSGVVYPYPVIEKIEDEKKDKDWNAVYIENKYIKIMILPELGGRVQMAYDKVKERHFVYYNSVIKPALVGLTGPWISGGIEFNWPQHHRPTTYDKVDSLIEENEDGSVTVWCSEIERMFRTKGMAGFTLHPDKAYLEIHAKLYNRTSQPQTFLWWANPAVKVNDDYQSVFPPDVNAVFDHGKRDVSEYPIAKGTYYKVDYSAGVDISKYKNIPVPTSYMAVNSKYDFVGGYENDSKGGMLHVADHHQSPGKKQWTWGHSDFGRAWDRNLTDTDGPYIELMCGVYTDNQPDFTWLQPYEEKSFKQYFMPYRDLGVVKNATKEAMINVEEEDGKTKVRVYVTSVYNNAKIIVSSKDKVVKEYTLDLSPEMSFEESIGELIALEDIKVEVLTEKGIELVNFELDGSAADREVPESANPAKDPEDIDSIEQLYLRGLHLEQYRHATYNPTDYYLEALRREPSSVQNNNAMGLYLIRKGKFAEAEKYLKIAVETLTERNPNPYDGEPLFNLGLSQRFQGKEDEAYGSFFKATWNGAWQDSGFFQCAQIDAKRGDLDKALDLVDRSLWKNWLNHKARHLKIMLLREVGRTNEALALVEESLRMDRFNFGALYEKYLLTFDVAVKNQLVDLMRDNVHNFIEISLDYANAGFYKNACTLTSIHTNKEGAIYPMALYFEASYHMALGNTELAQTLLEKASQQPADYCFPNKLEELVVLQEVTQKWNTSDAKAWYYLGNIWYSFRQYDDAMTCLEKSRDIDFNFPTVHRNLSLGYFNKLNESKKALQSLETAFELDKTDARVFMELDQLYKKLNHTPEFRLQKLEENLSLVEQRDDLYLERLTILNVLGRYAEALELIMNRQFHPWEGGEGKVTGQYLISNIELAKVAIKEGKFAEAIEFLKATEKYPENLGEGKLFGTQENDINYWMGCAYEGLGDLDNAKKFWTLASIGLSEPVIAMYYNDQQPDKIFYQAMALIKLNNTAEAEKRFNKLVNYGEEQLQVPFKMDYFAVSLPDLLIFEEDLQIRHELHCHYLIALGNLGLAKGEQAEASFKTILDTDAYHYGARLHAQMNGEQVEESV